MIETAASQFCIQDDLRESRQRTAASVWEALRGRSIFMTGGTGFVGGWLSEMLLEANRVLRLGMHLTLLSRHPERFLQGHSHLAADPALHMLSGDATDFAVPDTRFDMIVHAALPVDDVAPGALEHLAMHGARRVVELARTRGCDRVLHVSSGAVYGPQKEGFVTEDTAWDVSAPANEYTRAKRVEEKELSCLPYGCVTARCFALIGPGLSASTGTAAAQFIAQAAQGEPITVLGDGLSIRTYLYASDLARWLVHLLALGQPGRAYNVGSETPIEIRALARKVSALAGGNGAPQVCGSLAPGRAGLRYVPSTDRARSELGLSTHVELDEAIVRSLRWQRSQLTITTP